MWVWAVAARLAARAGARGGVVAAGPWAVVAGRAVVAAVRRREVAGSQ